MKRILSLVFVLVSVFCYADSVQQGCVKTRGRMINGKHVPGQGLPGSIVSIKDRTAIGVKNSNGTFSFPVTDNHFRIDSVKKKDYVLLDADAASKTYTHTADTLFFVMETPEQILQDKLATERRLRRSLQAKLQTRENELDSLIAIQKISQEEYQQRLQKLYAEQSENDKLISDMAERYSTLDYDQMDEFYRQISYYIEQCEFTKADSLLKTRGDVNKQIEEELQRGQVIDKKKKELRRAEVVHQCSIDELAKRCYSYYENYKMQYQNDSALFYLEQRLRLDTLNVQWMIEMIEFFNVYIADYPKALQYCNRALNISLNQYGEMHNVTATIYSLVSEVYFSEGNFKKALDYLEKIRVIREQLLDEMHMDRAEIYANIGGIYAMYNKIDSAMIYYDKSLSIYASMQDPKTAKDLATLYNNIGYLYGVQYNLDKQQEYYEKALEIRKKIYGNISPDLVVSYNNLASLYLRKKDMENALVNVKKGLEMALTLYGEKHHAVARSYLNMGTVYLDMEDYTKAIEIYKKSLVIVEKLGLDISAETGRIHNQLGNAYAKMKDYETAIIHFEKSLTIEIEVFGESHYRVAIARANIGAVYLYVKDYTRALEHSLAALTILKQQLGDSHPTTASVYIGLAEIYLDMNDLRNALQYYEKALVIYEQKYSSDNGDLIDLKRSIGDVNKRLSQKLE